MAPPLRLKRSGSDRALSRRALLGATLVGAGGLALVGAPVARRGTSLAQQQKPARSLIATISKNDVNGFTTWRDNAGNWHTARPAGTQRGPPDGWDTS